MKDNIRLWSVPLSLMRSRQREEDFNLDGILLTLLTWMKVTRLIITLISSLTSSQLKKSFLLWLIGSLKQKTTNKILSTSPWWNSFLISLTKKDSHMLWGYLFISLVTFINPSTLLAELTLNTQKEMLVATLFRFQIIKGPRTYILFGIQWFTSSPLLHIL